jgi:hypothetical protein
MSKKDGKSTIALLQLIAAATIKLDESNRLLKSVRQEVERNIWSDQSTNPHFERSVEDLELSARASNYVPGGVETMGQLCQYRASELSPTGNRYLMEIRDSLRVLGLVLRPED